MHDDVFVRIPEIAVRGVLKNWDDTESVRARERDAYYVESVGKCAVYFNGTWCKVMLIKLLNGDEINICERPWVDLFYEEQLNKDVADGVIPDSEIPFTDLDDVFEESDELP